MFNAYESMSQDTASETSTESFKLDFTVTHIVISRLFKPHLKAESRRCHTTAHLMLISVYRCFSAGFCKQNVHRTARYVIGNKAIISLFSVQKQTNQKKKKSFHGGRLILHFKVLINEFHIFIYRKPYRINIRETATI